MNKFKYTTLAFATLLAFTTLTGCANTDGKDTNNKVSQETENASDEVDKYKTIDPTFVKGKDIFKTDVKSIKGTTEYEEVKKNSKNALAANYDLSAHIEEGQEDRYDFYNSSNVLFEDMLKQKEDKYLVYVFSPSCLYCKAYYDTLVTYTDALDSLPMYKLNLDIFENSELLANYNVQGTPTMLVVKKGKVVQIVKGSTDFYTLMDYSKF